MIGDAHAPRATDTALELEGHRYQQAPQATTAAGPQLYFILICKFNNAAHRRVIVLSYRRIEILTHHRTIAPTCRRIDASEHRLSTIDYRLHKNQLPTINVSTCRRI